MAERLTHGDQGEWVEYLQKMLDSKGINPGAVDGVFGDKLATTVRQYQTDCQLTVDGVVGEATWESLTAVSEKRRITIDWEKLPFLSALAQYDDSDDGVRQFLTTYDIDVDLITREA